MHNATRNSLAAVRWTKEAAHLEQPETDRSRRSASRRPNAPPLQCTASSPGHPDGGRSGLGPHQAESLLERRGPFQGDLSMVWCSLGRHTSLNPFGWAASGGLQPASEHSPSGQASSGHHEATPKLCLPAHLITPSL